MKFVTLGLLLVPGGLCAGGNTDGLVSMMPASLPSPADGANVTQPPVLPDGNAASMAPVPLFGIFALPVTSGSVLACGVAAALAWSCRHRCCSAYEAAVERSRDKKRRGDFSAVSTLEQDGLLSAGPDCVATCAGGSDSGDDDGWGGLEGTPIVLAPLRLLGEAIKERLLSSSSRKGKRRRGDDDEERGDVALYNDPRSTEEEARGLLAGPESWREDVEDQDMRPVMRPRSPVRSSPKRSPKRRADSEDEDMDDDQAAVAALMKLRPAACDSLGHDDEDDEAARPLVGSERAMFLSR